MVHLNIFQNVLILVELFIGKGNFKIYQLDIIKKYVYIVKLKSLNNQ